MSKDSLILGTVARERPPAALRRRFAIVKLPIGSKRTAGRFFSEVEKIRALCGPAWNRHAFDLLNVMCVLRAADRYYRSAGLFANTRDLRIAIGVTAPRRWQALAPALRRTVFLLSGDRLTLHAHGTHTIPDAAKPAARSTLAQALDDYHPDCVCLFSGGADSFCGAAHLLACGRRPLLVAHAVGAVSGRQIELFDALRDRFPQLGTRALVQLRTYPRSPARGARVPRGTWRQQDDLQRLRSMHFLSLAALIAHAHALDDVFMCENGIIGAAIAFSPHEDTPYTTRPSEPRYLRGMQQFLNAALDAPSLRLRNPFQYMTKGEVLRDTARLGLTEALYRTVSCWRSGNRGVRNCGECVPCLFRQLAFAEAGLPRRRGDYYGHAIPPLRWHLWQSDARHRLAAVRAYADAVHEGGRTWLLRNEEAVTDAIDVTGGAARLRAVDAGAVEDLDDHAAARMAAAIDRFARATLARLQ
jgi:7-cyano-7-deazaguanine synthase in queuosine biosynthesis